jgi:hypothetical protein
VIKVETFLRMNKIEYTSDFKNFFGPKGKCPWITDTKGRAVADSEMIIEHLVSIPTRVTRLGEFSPIG